MLNIQTEKGEINVSTEVIEKIAGITALESYGLVGMASQSIKDGIAELLRKENFNKGINVTKEEDGTITLDMYVIMLYGVKISEVAGNVQQQVKHSLENMLGISVDKINIYVQGIKVEKEEKK
jgi:uncharacterized alkaline shock family protein YloU